MSQSTSIWDALAIAFVSLVVGGMSFIFTGSLFNFFFVTAVVAVLWDNSIEVGSIRKKLMDLKAKSGTPAP